MNSPVSQRSAILFDTSVCRIMMKDCLYCGRSVSFVSTCLLKEGEQSPVSSGFSLQTCTGLSLLDKEFCFFQVIYFCSHVWPHILICKIPPRTCWIVACSTSCYISACLCQQSTLNDTVVFKTQRSYKGCKKKMKIKRSFFCFLFSLV